MLQVATKWWITLIVSLLLFLTFSQKAHAQSSWTTTKNSVNYICIRTSLADTIIHDLKERKLLLVKDSILIVQNSILKNENRLTNTNYNETQKSLIISQFKSKRNAWQRNLFIVTTIIATYLCIR